MTNPMWVSESTSQACGAVRVPRSASLVYLAGMVPQEGGP